jgi:hypothetical protein
MDIGVWQNFKEKPSICKRILQYLRGEGGGDVKAMQKFVIRINNVIHML